MQTEVRSEAQDGGRSEGRNEIRELGVRLTRVKVLRSYSGRRDSVYLVQFIRCQLRRTTGRIGRYLGMYHVMERDNVRLPTAQHPPRDSQRALSTPSSPPPRPNHLHYRPTSIILLFLTVQSPHTRPPHPPPFPRPLPYSPRTNTPLKPPFSPFHVRISIQVRSIKPIHKPHIVRHVEHERVHGVAEFARQAGEERAVTGREGRWNWRKGHWGGIRKGDCGYVEVDDEVDSVGVWGCAVRQRRTMMMVRMVRDSTSRLLHYYRYLTSQCILSSIPV